jgi:hypothetical protein
MPAAGYPETSALIDKTTLHHLPENCYLTGNFVFQLNQPSRCSNFSGLLLVV